MGLVNSCCCGCTLAQGTIGVGIVSVIRALLILVAGGGILVNDGSDNEINDFSKARGHDSGNRIFGWCMVLDGVILLLASIFLFLGVKTKRRCYILPWLIVVGAGFVFAIPLLTYRVAAGPANVLQLAIFIAVISVMIYLYIVVLSYYKSLQTLPFTDTPIQTVPTTVYSYNQPGYVISPTDAEGYSAVPTNYKPFQPVYAAYPANLPPAGYPPNLYNDQQMPQYQSPPPPYSDVAVPVGQK